MSYYDGLNSVEMFRAGTKSMVEAQEDIEFQKRLCVIDGDEYNALMDMLGVAPARRYGGAKVYGMNSCGVPFYVRGTNWMYRRR